MTLDPGPGLLIGLPLALAAGVVMARSLRETTEESPLELGIQAGLALFMSAGYFASHPRVLVDDAGFIIRYLLQSDQGCWYCFNAADGPMFGISSFSYGALALLLYRVGLGSPERCLLLLGMVGTFASAWLLLRILRRLSARRWMSVPLGFMALFGAKSWMMVGASSMEVPIHTAFVLGALFCLVTDRGRALWFWLAMAVVSKLDAAPIAVAFGLIHLLRHRASWSRRTGNPILEGLVWAGLPLAVWVAFSFWYFGSPLPHSAAAKLLLHRSVADHWFPFGERYLRGAWLRVMFGLFLVLWPLQVLRRRTRGVPGDTAPGWAFLALLALYYFYNPAERMEWYYALPDLFLVLQVLLSLQALGDLFRGAAGHAVVAAMLCVGSLGLVDAARGVSFFTRYLRSLEGERAVAGRAIAARLGKDDVLMSGHGLLSAWAPGRVLDYSGLNSQITLDLGGNWIRMVRELRPDGLVAGGYEYYLSPLQGLPYRIDQTFYEIADEGAPPWHFFRRGPREDPFFLGYAAPRDFAGADTVPNGLGPFRAEGRAPVWSASPREPAPRFFRVGIRRPDDASTHLLIATSWEGQPLEEMRFEIPQAEERPERSLHWHAVVVPLDVRYSGRVGYRVSFSMASGGPVHLYDPIVTRN